MKLTSGAWGGNRPPFSFRRDLLPIPSEYYKGQGLKLTGRGEWRNAICLFHDDTRPSLRVHLGSDASACWARGNLGDATLTETAKEGARCPAGFMLATVDQPEAFREYSDQKYLPTPNRGDVL